MSGGGGADGAAQGRERPGEARRNVETATWLQRVGTFALKASQMTPLAAPRQSPRDLPLRCPRQATTSPSLLDAGSLFHSNSLPWFASERSKSLLLTLWAEKDISPPVHKGLVASQPSPVLVAIFPPPNTQGQLRTTVGGALALGSHPRQSLVGLRGGEGGRRLAVHCSVLEQDPFLECCPRGEGRLKKTHVCGASAV